jgi:hypothetical protein
VGGAIDFQTRKTARKLAYRARKKKKTNFFSFPEVELRPDLPGLRRFRQFVGVFVRFGYNFRAFLHQFSCVFDNFFAILKQITIFLQSNSIVG